MEDKGLQHSNEFSGNDLAVMYFWLKLILKKKKMYVSRICLSDSRREKLK